MPEISQRIREQCNLQKMPLFQVAPIAYLKAGHKIGEVFIQLIHVLPCIQPKPLFAKMEPSLLEELKIKFGGSTAASLEASKNSKTSGKTKPGFVFNYIYCLLEIVYTLIAGHRLER